MAGYLFSGQFSYVSKNLIICFAEFSKGSQQRIQFNREIAFIEHPLMLSF